MNIRAAWDALWAECDWRHAVRSANSILKSGEGVNLLYYRCSGVDEEEESLIRRVIS